MQGKKGKDAEKRARRVSCTPTVTRRVGVLCTAGRGMGMERQEEVWPRQLGSEERCAVGEALKAFPE